MDEFEKRVDIILVDTEKIEDLKNPAFECATTKPKVLLALEGKIVHEIYGPNVSELEDNVKKFAPYIWTRMISENYFYLIHLSPIDWINLNFDKDNQIGWFDRIDNVKNTILHILADWEIWGQKRKIEIDKIVKIKSEFAGLFDGERRLICVQSA